MKLEIEMSEAEALNLFGMDPGDPLNFNWQYEFGGSFEITDKLMIMRSGGRLLEFKQADLHAILVLMNMKKESGLA